MHALPARIIDRRSITFRNMTPRIEQSPVQIQREQTYRHKEKTRYTKGTKSTKRTGNECRVFFVFRFFVALFDVIMRAPLQQNLGGKRDAKTRIVSCSDRPGVDLLVCLRPGL